MQCAICQQPMKTIPAGISKTTEKPYSAFEACEDRSHKQPRSNQTSQLVTPEQKFTSQLNNQKEENKWQKISEGKVRTLFSVKAYEMGKSLNSETANEIIIWTNFCMTGKLNQSSTQDYPNPSLE